MNCKVILMLALVFGFTNTLPAQERDISQANSQEIRELKSRLYALETAQFHTQTEVYKLQESIRDNAPVLVLFGIFCAWWAQNTGRNAWLWFFLGALFHVFTGIALLIKNRRST